MALIDNFGDLLEFDEESSSSSSDSEDVIRLNEFNGSDEYINGKNTIVKYDVYGNAETISNDALFAYSKDEAKSLPGGAKQISGNEVLVSDPIHKRAFIFDFERNRVTWNYRSDRAIVDCFVSPEEDVLTISLTDGATTYIDRDVVVGTVIVWENNRTENTTVYSGETTYDEFQEDPDLLQYGKLFESPLLQSGERYAYVVNIAGEYNWFEYPTIITGKVTASTNRVSTRTKFTLVESDGLESPYTGRIVQIDTWGNELWSFGTNFLVKPLDATSMVGNKVLVSV